MNRPRLNNISLIIWAVLYLFSGYISLLLDNPENGVARVWFPAGVAVSAFLYTQRKNWLLLYLTLFCVRTLLDVTMRHSVKTSLFLSLISLCGDFCVAWAVLHFGRHRDDLKKVSIWQVATLIISALPALLASGWLSTLHELPFLQTVGRWWAANVSGTIVATTVLVGLTLKRTPLSVWQYISAGIGILLVSLSAMFIFKLPPATAESVGLIYGLACIPVLLTVLVAVVAGNQAGALSFLVLCIIVISFSWQQTGPFFIEGLFHGESLLLAQIYLSGTALLIIFIRLQAPRSGTYKATDNATAFRLETATGHIDWDLHVASPLSGIVMPIRTRNMLHEAIPAEVMQQMQSRWKAVISGIPVPGELVFQITLPDKSRHTISEQNLFCIPAEEGSFIIGYWSLVPDPVHFIRTTEEE